MLNGLDLFSGIGGLTLALAPWVRPVAYCEVEPYAQSVLFTHMRDGKLPIAPIWDDITTLRCSDLPRLDIVYGGFPCQDISTAGSGHGLDGERSGLYFQVERVVRETSPTFVFLENVPAIRTRGGERVVKGLASLGYDCRWTAVSAADIGANHRRTRWFLLAYSSGSGCVPGKPEDGPGQNGASSVERQADGRNQSTLRCRYELGLGPGWWASEPSVGRVVNGIPARVDRIRALGNSVVPGQAREAFKTLMGLEAA